MQGRWSRSGRKEERPAAYRASRNAEGDEMLTLSLTRQSLDSGTPEEQATFGILEVLANRRCLTEGVAGDANELLPGPVVSGYHLAEWLAWNRWAARRSLAWRRRTAATGHHCLHLSPKSATSVRGRAPLPLRSRVRVPRPRPLGRTLVTKPRTISTFRRGQSAACWPTTREISMPRRAASRSVQFGETASIDTRPVQHY